MFDNIRGVITFKAICAKPEAFINRIKQSEVPCFNIHCTNGELFGNTYKKYYTEIYNIAKKENTEIFIDSQKGLVFKAIKYKKRLGIIIGAIIAIGFIFYMSNIVLKIEITGNDAISNDQILAILNENEISYGKFIPGLDFGRTERNIMTSLKNLSWVGIRSRGGRIIVEIDEMVKSPEIVPQHVPCNIISTHNAQIISVKVYSGNLIPKVGDGVKKGDILISGTSTDKNGKSTVLHAQGIIIGQYNNKIVFSQKFADKENILSGEEICRNQFSFFGLKIPLYFGKAISGEYEYEENTNYFSFFNITLPIGITHETYRPFETEVVTYTPDEAKIKIMQQISNYEENFLEDIKIISKETQITSNKDEIKIVVLYMLEGEIGINKELLIK